MGTTSRGMKRKRNPEYTRMAEIAPNAGEGTQSESEQDQYSGFEGFSDTSDKDRALTPAQPEVPKGKYVPPAVRKAQMQSLPAKEQDLRLQKQLQGTLNRLSEANMATILTEIENLYRSHPRAEVTSALTSLLLIILTAPQTLLDTFVILHAGFVGALYRLIGIDFAAHLVQTIVEQFDRVYSEAGKDGINLMVFLSELYNFGVVGCGLIYDFIRMFLEPLGEYDTELLLKVIQNSGQQLRQDDPSALKEIVILMQSRVAAKDASTLSIRTKFMIDSIINLKNNRAKAATATSVVTSEATIRMKKFLSKLGEKNLRSVGEPLRVSLSDIRNVKKKGKWWLVGASWKNEELDLAPEGNKQAAQEELISLAKDQRMNTEIRRAVFIALMGSEVSSSIVL
jgi:nucleolar MIF4G domain-containing protein 1